jgi:hypothetical protein
MTALYVEASLAGPASSGLRTSGVDATMAALIIA